MLCCFWTFKADLHGIETREKLFIEQPTQQMNKTLTTNASHSSGNCVNCTFVYATCARKFFVCSNTGNELVWNLNDLQSHDFNCWSSLAIETTAFEDVTWYCTNQRLIIRSVGKQARLYLEIRSYPGISILRRIATITY